MKPYFLLVGINIFFLYFISLYPFRELMTHNYELGGIFFMFLSWILWLPAATLVFLTYGFIEKRTLLNHINRKVIVGFTVLCQFASVFSVTPGMALLFRRNKQVEASKFKTSNPINEKITKVGNRYIYSYDLPVTNLTKTNQSISYRLIPVVDDPEAYTKVCPLVSAEYNSFIDTQLVPGENLVHGELVLFEYIICKDYTPINSQVRVQVGIDTGRAEFFRNVDTSLTGWTVVYAENEASN